MFREELFSKWRAAIPRCKAHSRPVSLMSRVSIFVRKMRGWKAKLAIEVTSCRAYLPRQIPAIQTLAAPLLSC
jgi:hypothetical protein